MASRLIISVVTCGMVGKSRANNLRYLKSALILLLDMVGFGIEVSLRLGINLHVICLHGAEFKKDNLYATKIGNA